MRFGTGTAQVFIRFLELVKRLILGPDDTVYDRVILVLDNSSIHRDEFVKAYLEDQDYTTLYLPPYSPELATIEHYFATVKHHVRDQVREKTVVIDSDDGLDVIRCALIQTSTKSIRKLFINTRAYMRNLISLLFDY